ncbi:MAG: hypothetical protein JJU13_12920 [Balneolaceae bacterium]|jgi:hypothetical protein|nr:hypothetical protein [Balneolaceae bacterium]
MAKISKDLLSRASDQPNEKFMVMIVLTDEKAAGELPIKNYKSYMGNILSATVTGAQITELNKLDSVESVEIDGEVRAL